MTCIASGFAVGGAVLSRVPVDVCHEACLHAAEQAHELRGLRARKIAQRILDRLLGDAPDAPVHPLGLFGQIDALHPPITVERAALDPTVRLHPVDHAARAPPLAPRVPPYRSVVPPPPPPPPPDGGGALGRRPAGLARQGREKKPLGARD